MGDRTVGVSELNAETIERRNRDFRNPVCIHTEQVYDSCRDRDCLRDLRVFFTAAGQEVIDRAISVKIKSAEVIWVYTDVYIYKHNSQLCVMRNQKFSN